MNLRLKESEKENVEYKLGNRDAIVFEPCKEVEIADESVAKFILRQGKTEVASTKEVKPVTRLQLKNGATPFERREGNNSARFERDTVVEIGNEAFAALLLAEHDVEAVKTKQPKADAEVKTKATKKS